MSREHPKYETVDGRSFRIGIAAARYNGDLVDPMLEKVRLVLSGARVPAEQGVETVRVPGSGELPCACALLAARGGFDALIALGVVIRGETPHYDILAHTTAYGLQDVSLRYQVPVINGIIVADQRAQAQARATGSIDRGTEFAQAALHMARLRQQWTPPTHHPE